MSTKETRQIEELKFTKATHHDSLGDKYNRGRDEDATAGKHSSVITTTFLLCVFDKKKQSKRASSASPVMRGLTPACGFQRDDGHRRKASVCPQIKLNQSPSSIRNVIYGRFLQSSGHCLQRPATQLITSSRYIDCSISSTRFLRRIPTTLLVILLLRRLPGALFLLAKNKREDIGF